MLILVLDEHLQRIRIEHRMDAVSLIFHPDFILVLHERRALFELFGVLEELPGGRRSNAKINLRFDDVLEQFMQFDVLPALLKQIQRLGVFQLDAR